MQPCASVKALVSARPDRTRMGREKLLDIAARVRLAHACRQVNCGSMRTGARVSLASGVLLVLSGCTAERAAKSEGDAKAQTAKTDPAKTEPTLAPKLEARASEDSSVARIDLGQGK